MKSKNALLSLKAFPCICQNDCVICGTFIVEGRCQLFVIELLTEGACDWRGKWLLGLKMHNIFFYQQEIANLECNGNALERDWNRVKGSPC